MDEYLCVLDYTNGSVDIIRDSKINPEGAQNFDYENWISENYGKCETNWIVCNALNLNL